MFIKKWLPHKEKCDGTTEKKPKKQFPHLPYKKPKAIYGDQLVCGISLLIMAIIRSGPRAAVIGAFAVITCIIVDFICCKLTKKKYNPKDLSTIFAGVCITLMMPITIDYPVLILGCALTIGIKHIFGGKDNYIFNPTAVSIAFLILTYPDKLLLYPKVGETIPIFGSFSVPLSSGLESYILRLSTSQNLSFIDVLIGNFQGAIGTVHVLVLIVCAICMMCRRSVSPLITITGLSTFFLISFAFPLYSNVFDTLMMELIGGFLLFGFVFLANDPQTVPKTATGKIIYGMLLGILSVVFRYFGKVQGSFVFALLVANALSIHIDKFAVFLVVSFKKYHAILKKRLGSYERISEDAKTGHTPNLADTQEIIIPHTNYNMPPIDNKVIKIKRKNGNLIDKIKNIGKDKKD